MNFYDFRWSNNNSQFSIWILLPLLSKNLMHHFSKDASIWIWISRLIEFHKLLHMQFSNCSAHNKKYTRWTSPPSLWNFNFPELYFDRFGPWFPHLSSICITLITWRLTCIHRRLRSNSCRTKLSFDFLGALCRSRNVARTYRVEILLFPGVSFGTARGEYDWKRKMDFQNKISEGGIELNWEIPDIFQCGRRALNSLKIGASRFSLTQRGLWGDEEVNQSICITGFYRKGNIL